MSNWKAFREGNCEGLCKEIVEHLNKFANRSFNFNSFQPKSSATTENINESRVSGEFSKIIESYENRKKNKQKMIGNGTDSNDEDRNQYKPLRDTYLTTKPANFVNRNNITLSELNQIEGNEYVKSTDEVSLEKRTQSDIKVKKYKATEVAISKTNTDYSHLIYPERIKIPKHKHRKDCLYKLNDCYYDSDGEFLYRVPGMS